MDDDCRRRLAELMDEIDGELSAPCRRELEEHLAGCRGCADCRLILERTLALCRRREPVPADARQSIREAVRRALRPGNGT